MKCFAVLNVSALVVALFVPRAGLAAPATCRTDALGDALPPDALLRLGTVRLRHPDLVESLAFAPDGKTLASADKEGRVRLWSPDTGRLQLELPPGTGTNLALAPDGKVLATAGSEAVRLWSPTDGRAICTLSKSGGPPLAFAPNGKRLLCAGANGTILLIDVNAGKVVRRFEGLERFVSALAFSPDGKAVAAGGQITTNSHPTGISAIFIWDVATGRKRCRIDDDSSYRVNGLAFTPDSKKVVTSSKQVWLWDATTGKLLEELDIRARGVVAFAPGGKQMVSGFNVCIWDTSSWELIHQMEQGEGPSRIVAIAPDGKTIASNSAFDGRIRLWDSKTGREKFTEYGHLGTVGTVVFSPDGRLLATGSGSDETIRFWNPLSGAAIRTPKYHNGPHKHLFRISKAGTIAFSPDSRVLVIATNPYVLLWDRSTGKIIRALLDRDSPEGRLWTTAASLSPDGRLLATSGGGLFARLWESSTGKLLRRIRHYGEHARRGVAVPCLAFSPDGNTLATGSFIYPEKIIAFPSEFQVQLWDTGTGKERLALEPSGSPAFLAFSPDGQVLATSSTRDHPTQFWTVATGREVRRLALPGKSPKWDRISNPLAFSPNGQLLATGGWENTVVLWEVATGQVVRTLRGHTGPVLSLAFTPDGRTLVSGSADTTALVWPVVPLRGLAVRPEAWHTRTGDQLWSELAGETARSYPALWALVDAPAKAVPLLKKWLRPDSQVDAREVARLVAALGSQMYSARREATRRLRQLGRRVEPALRQARQGRPDLERLRRIEQLLVWQDDSTPDADLLRDLRAIQALEQMGTAPAQEVLKRLARGADLGSRTTAARAALLRLKNRGTRK